MADYLAQLQGDLTDPDKIGAVLDELIRSTGHDVSRQKQVLLWKLDFNGAEKSRRSGTIEAEEYNVRINTIVDKAFDLIRDLATEQARQAPRVPEINQLPNLSDEEINEIIDLLISVMGAKEVRYELMAQAFGTDSRLLSSISLEGATPNVIENIVYMLKDHLVSDANQKYIALTILLRAVENHLTKTQTRLARLRYYFDP